MVQYNHKITRRLIQVSQTDIGELEMKKNAEYLNRMIAYWQDLVYYFTETNQLDKAKVAKHQLDGYLNAYYSI